MANELSNLKPFNLEAALKGEKVVTRDGREVKDIAHLPSSKSGYVVAGVLDGDIATFTEEGGFCIKNPYPDEDLFMAPKERVVWVNLYGNLGIESNCGYFYDALGIADRLASPGRIGGKAFSITITEGK